MSPLGIKDVKQLSLTVLLLSGGCHSIPLNYTPKIERPLIYSLKTVLTENVEVVELHLLYWCRKAISI